jgi:transposase
MKRTCGLDVHKDTIFCAIYNGEKHGPVTEYPTVTPSIRAMGDFIHSQGVEIIAMESTGMYWIPIWNILEDMGFTLMLVNPYLIKQMPGRKSDVKDAQWIATLLHKGLLRSSLVPCRQIRELRTYSRKYVKLQQRQTAVLTEMERTMEMCSIRITSFVSNISGKSIQKVIRQIVQGETNPKVLAESIHGRIVNKHKKEVVEQALTGFITAHHRFILEQSLEEFDMLVSQSSKCLSKMSELCKEHYKDQMKLLLTIPGISDISAMIILAETGADMKAFENSGKFSGWTGLRPRNDESAGKYKSTATTKGNRYFRAVLVQIAWAAIRTKGSSFKEKFNRLAMRKSRKKALIAIARKIGVVIWNVLYFEKVYNAEMLVIYDQVKLDAKIAYHQKEHDRLQKLAQR